jgi:hypothetical protein
MLPFLYGCDKGQEKGIVNLQFPSESWGCASFIVYKINGANKTSIAVKGNRDKLDLSMTEQTFDLSKTDSDVLSVEIVRYDKLTNDGYYYDDVAGDEITDRWTSTSGTVKVRIVRDYEDDLPDREKLYTITVRIENVILKNDKGDAVKADRLEFNDVQIGMMVG